MMDDALTCASTANRVDGNIWISGCYAAADPRLVAKIGATRIVKLFPDDLSYRGGFHRHPNVTYLVIDAEDSAGFPLHEYFADCLDFIQKGIREKEQILVHCHAGVSRSATIVLVHLMVNRGMTLDEALGCLCRSRPCVRPNSGFMNSLRELEARIEKIRAREAMEALHRFPGLASAPAPIPFPDIAQRRS